MRRSVLAVGAAVVIFGPTALAFFSGGFFGPARLIAAMAACALVIVVVALTPRPLPSSTAGRVALGGLALLTVWTAVSMAWAPLGGRAQDDLERLVLYLAFFFAATVLLRGAQVRRWLEPALVLGTFVVIAYALSERLLPGVFEFARSESAGGRLEQPTSVAAPGPPAIAIRTSNDLNRLVIDDGTNLQNPDPIAFGRGGLPLSASNTLRGGDTATGTIGVMT